MSEQQAPKPKTYKVGDVIPVGERKSVTYPESSNTVVVTGGEFVLDRPGMFVVDGTEVTAK